MTRVMPCECRHEYQDRRYGRGRRVFNMMKPRKEQQEWRCTVCMKVRIT